MILKLRNEEKDESEYQKTPQIGSLREALISFKGIYANTFLLSRDRIELHCSPAQLDQKMP